MNWVDLVIILLLLFFAFEGLGRSFIGEFLDFLAFLAAFVLSLRFYNLLGGFLETQFNIPHSMANVLGFIGVWFIVEGVFFVLIQIAFWRIRFIHKLNQKLNPLAIIPAFLRGVIFISILLLIMATFPIQPTVKKSVNESVIGSFLLDKSQRLEKPLKNVFGGLSNDTFSFLTIKPRSDETVNLGFQSDEFKPRPDLETKMIELVNKERVSRGLKPLSFRVELLEVGRSHSADMFKRGYFSHYSPEGRSVADRADERGVDYLVIGENLAYAPSLDLAHKGLMDSPGHRANILSEDYNQIAIGIMDGGVYGLMITQVFSN